jgi:HAD superfamily hydrolase (TIGR01490 family)
MVTTPQERRVAAYFDLDGTLLAVNSAKLWLRREWKNGRINAYQGIRGVGFLLLYRAGVANIENATTAALNTIIGIEEQAVIDWTENWYDTDVAHHAAPGSWATIEAHREAGHALILLTSSSPYEAKKALAHYNLESSLSSHYEVTDGKFTGNPVLPLCYGAGKIHYAEAHAKEANIDVDNSYFYTDSYTDLPMLERVANPRIINPDGRLARTSRKRGWPIIDWSTRTPEILIDR